MRAAWLLGALVVGCGEDDFQNPVLVSQECKPNSFEISGVSDVPLHGGTIEVTRRGLQGAFFGRVVREDNETSVFFEQKSPGVFEAQINAFDHPVDYRIEIFDNASLRPLGAMCGQQVSTPGVASLGDTFGDPHDFSVPLRPELSYPRARIRAWTLTNFGDEPLPSPVVTGAGFSIDHNCGGLGYAQSCTITVGFESTTPGVHAGTLTVATAVRAFEVTVLEPTPGVVKATIANAGYALPGITDGTNLFGYGFNVTLAAFDAAGLESDTHLLGVEPHGFPSSSIMALHIGTPSYAVIATDGSVLSALARLDANRTVDPTFAPVDIPVCNIASTINDLVVQPSGRIVVLGRNCATAFTPAGAIDSTYGTNGVADYSGLSPFAHDSTGRVYVGSGTTLSRLLVDGTPDPAFSFNGEIGAVTLDANDQITVFRTGSVLRLDDTGSPTTLPLSLAASDLRDADIDGSGRLYITTFTGSVLQYAADGTFLREVDLDRAQGVVCPATGGCWVIGSELGFVDYVARLEP